jgi:hypothetical protein
MPSIINATTTNGVVTSADNSGSLQLATNSGTTAVTIGTTQNIGIGATDNANIRVLVRQAVDSDVGGIGFQSVNGASTAVISELNSGALVVRNGGAERMRIAGNGDVGIGTNSPATKLHVSGVITATGGVTGTPTFSAIQNAATALSAGTTTKVNFPLEQWDTNSNYNTANSRFTPTVAGYYQISSTVRADISSNGVLHIYVRKNGVDEYAGNFIGTTSSQCATTGTWLMYLNGSTDYVEIAVFSGNAGNTSSTNQTSFQGCLVRAA